MVKNIVGLIALVLLFSSCGQQSSSVTTMSTEKKTPKIAEEGYQLNYNLASGGERYQFVVEIEKLQSFIQFDYTLTMKVKKHGSIKITEEGVKSAKRMKNYFGNGKTVLPDSITTVWASRETYNDIVRKGVCSIHVGEPFSTYQEYSLVGIEEYTCEVNGKRTSFNTLHIKESSASGYEFWILDNADNPLIIRMKVGFEISLKEVFHRD